MKLSTKEKFISALRLFAIFFKIGLFSFGGGYAMFTMIEREVVEKHKYLTHDELMDVFAIAESTPGAVAVNTATFVGTKTAGIFGGLLATFGLMLPSLIIIMALSYAIGAVRDNKWVTYLFQGIRAGVLVLIAKAVISFIRNMRKSWFDFVLLVSAFAVAFLTEVSVIYIIIGTIVICILSMVITNAIKKKKSLQNPESNDQAEDGTTAEATDGESTMVSAEDSPIGYKTETDLTSETAVAENKTENTNEGGLE